MPRPKTPKISKRIDPYVTSLLEKASAGKHVLRVRKGDKIFAQGDAADAIFFLQTGKVKISVVSQTGKEAVLGLLGPPNFFGEVP
jgi:CRP-like cAMP-binding protein